MHEDLFRSKHDKYIRIESIWNHHV